VQSAYCFVVIAALGCIPSLLCQPAVPANESAQTANVIAVENARLSASFDDQRLSVVSHMIVEKSQIRIVLADGIGDDLASMHVNSAALDVALRNLFSKYDGFFFYSGSQDEPSSLRAIWVYPRGTASTVRPISPSGCASTMELETALGDSDPIIREAAYETLLERPDRFSRTVIVDVVRGFRESDSGLRERLLSRGISKGFPFAADLLADLARTDLSEQIRWMALDALSEYPSVREVAQAATTDPSEAVRFRATQILQQLNSEH
jgi:hypothetical protein